MVIDKSLLPSLFMSHNIY